MLRQIFYGPLEVDLFTNHCMLVRLQDTRHCVRVRVTCHSIVIASQFRENHNRFFVCLVDKNVHALEWQGLTNAEKSELEKGVELQRTSFKQEYIPDFNQFIQSVQTTFGTLLRTYFLAVEDGLHNFTSECQDRCKVWIRKDGCHERKLILDQNTKKQHQ